MLAVVVGDNEGGGGGGSEDVVSGRDSGVDDNKMEHLISDGKQEKHEMCVI